MCVTRFNPSEPCCGQSEKCQLCAGIDWNRYMYAVTHEETRRGLGNSLYSIENGEVVTSTPTDPYWIGDVVLRANNVPAFPLLSSFACTWYTPPTHRGAWRWSSNFGLDAPVYADVKADFFSEWDGRISNRSLFLPEETAVGAWSWNSFIVSAEDRRTEPSFVESEDSPGYLEWGYGLVSNVDALSYFGGSYAGYGGLLGWRIRHVPGVNAFELTHQSGVTAYERIRRDNWNCSGPNIFVRRLDYSGPNIPQTVRVELKRRKDSDQIFTAFRHFGNGDGQSLITSIPDLA